MQARSLDPVAHPRAIQPLDQNTEVRLQDNYYVVSHRDKSMAENNGCVGLSDVIQILRILVNSMIKYALSPQTHFYPILT